MQRFSGRRAVGSFLLTTSVASKLASASMAVPRLSQHDMVQHRVQTAIATSIQGSGLSCVHQKGPASFLIYSNAIPQAGVPRKELWHNTPNARDLSLDATDLTVHRAEIIFYGRKLDVLSLRSDRQQPGVNGVYLKRVGAASPVVHLFWGKKKGMPGPEKGLGLGLRA